MKAETMILLSAVMVVVLIGGIWYINNSTNQQAIPIGPGGDVGTTTFNVCGDTNLGTPSFCDHNSLNPTYTCAATTVRMYQINSDGSYSLIATQLLTGGTTATATSTTLPCKDGTGAVIKYRAFFPAVNNVSTTDGYKSGYVDFDMSASAKPQVVFEGARIDILGMRMYDDTAKGYVYAASAIVDVAGVANTTNFQATGQTFNWNTTAVGTIGAYQSVIGTDGEINAVLHFKVPATYSTVAQADDGNVYFAVDIQSSDDWDNAVTNMGTLPRVTNVPTKISNLNYDIVFDGNSLKPIKGTEKTVNFYTKALSGVNPDDDIVIGFFTEGYFVSTASSNMGLGVSADDSSKTLVYNEQKWTIRID